jgi:anaerobic selenocysteine-containing dehydrogenase
VSRVSGRPEARGELPVAVLAEEMETPGEGQVRALITVAGNPARSTPDTERLERALGQLDVMISVDIYLNETTRHADVILPPPSALEKAHFDFAFYGLSVRNIANYSPPLFEPDGPGEHEILARLALILGGQGADGDPELIYGLMAGQVAQQATSLEGGPLHGRDPAELVAAVGHLPPPERFVDLMVRTGPFGDHFGASPGGVTLERLRANPHRIDLGPLVPRVEEVLRTASGLIELDSPPVLDDIARLAEVLDGPAAPEFVLVGRRHLRSNNSWMHNVEVLVKGRPRCTLQVHPDDATRVGLVDGKEARVRSRVGEVVAPVEVTDAIRPGVVSLPHGWGHDAAEARLEVAARHAGVNSNVLTDGSVLDALSGNCALNAIPVELAPA